MTYRKGYDWEPPGSAELFSVSPLKCHPDDTIRDHKTARGCSQIKVIEGPLSE